MALKSISAVIEELGFGAIAAPVRRYAPGMID
jgi:hypothetical protein